MRFENIKISKNKVILDRLDKHPDGSVFTINLENPNKPLPAFKTALQAFTGWACELIGAPQWAEDSNVASVHLSEEAKTRRRGLMVTLTRKIERAKDRVVTINTPLMHAPVDDQEGVNPGTFPQLVADMIDLLEEEATKYWNGEREQVELEFKGAPDTSTADGAAAAENDLTKQRRKKAKTDPKSGTPGEVWNPNSNTPPTDEQLRRLCLAAGRDVPLDAIGRWTSTERSKVQAWAMAAIDPNIKPSKRPEEPEILKKEATPALLEDVASAGDGWTDPTPPPKAEQVTPVVTG
jgi:hypothetical protein